MRPKIKNGIALALIPQFILVKWMANHPSWVEHYYSEGIYPVIAKFLRLLTGWIPFSFGDILYTVAGILVIRYCFKKWKIIRVYPFGFVRDVLMVCSLVYFVFHLYWGMNYYRIPIEEKLGFNTEYSKAELIDFTQRLIEETNKAQLALTNDSSQLVQIPYKNKKIFELTEEGYAKLQDKFPHLHYEKPSIKASIYSIPLTYMGYGGYLNPFTNEAQINGIIPKIRRPTISAHEVGHQLGYSSETSTNFIGFLVTSENDDYFFKYGAYTHALAYCLSDLRLKDEESFTRLWEELNSGVKKNYKQLNRFWEGYANVTEPVFKAVFNAFLKANNQTDGIKSYNAVVGLLIGYDQKFGFFE